MGSNMTFASWPKKGCTIISTVIMSPSTRWPPLGSERNKKKENQVRGVVFVIEAKQYSIFIKNKIYKNKISRVLKK